jgi:hypothetical protein
VATEAAWLGGENVSNEKNVEKSKKLLTGIGLLMEGLDQLLSQGEYDVNRRLQFNRLAVELPRLVSPLPNGLDSRRGKSGVALYNVLNHDCPILSHNYL